MPKIALITGANKGIGLKTARQLGNVGEIGITGVAAIGNALFNATGTPMRDLPITPEKIMR